MYTREINNASYHFFCRRSIWKWFISQRCAVGSQKYFSLVAAKPPSTPTSFQTLFVTWPFGDRPNTIKIVNWASWVSLERLSVRDTRNKRESARLWATQPLAIATIEWKYYWKWRRWIPCSWVREYLWMVNWLREESLCRTKVKLQIFLQEQEKLIPGYIRMDLERWSQFLALTHFKLEKNVLAICKFSTFLSIILIHRLWILVILS